MNREKGLPYTEAAEQRNVTGWSCKTCGRFWGSDEHMARYCCSTSSVCSDCQQACDKHYVRCHGCQQVREQKRWESLAVVDWNGEFPIGNFASDKFFFTMEDLLDYLNDQEFDELEHQFPVETLRQMKLTSCEPTEPRHFEIADLFEGCLGDDQDPPENKELENQVNEWVKSQQPFSYQMTGNRLNMDQIVAAVEAELSK